SVDLLTTMVHATFDSLDSLGTRFGVPVL
ncbi:hypothetical protein A2U01_0059792, partial [Trifolium medium]|nr:hypothetical protein [Trifolium medium]